MKTILEKLINFWARQKKLYWTIKHFSTFFFSSLHYSPTAPFEVWFFFSNRYFCFRVSSRRRYFLLHPFLGALFDLQLQFAFHVNNVENLVANAFRWLSAMLMNLNFDLHSCFDSTSNALLLPFEGCRSVEKKLLIGESNDYWFCNAWG